MARGVSLYQNTKLKIKGQTLKSNDLTALQSYFSSVCASDLQGAFEIGRVTCVNTSDNNGGFKTYIIKVTKDITCQMKSASVSSNKLVFKHLKGYKISDETTTQGDSTFYTMDGTSYQVISGEFNDGSNTVLFKKGTYRLKGLDLAQTTDMTLDDLYKLTKDDTTSPLLLNGEISSSLLDKSQTDNVVVDSSNSVDNNATSAAVQLNGYYAKGKNINYVATQRAYVKTDGAFTGDAVENYRFNTPHSFGKSYNKVKSIVNMGTSHTKPILIYEDWNKMSNGNYCKVYKTTANERTILNVLSYDSFRQYYVPSDAKILVIKRGTGILTSNEKIAAINARAWDDEYADWYGCRDDMPVMYARKSNKGGPIYYTHSQTSSPTKTETPYVYDLELTWNSSDYTYSIINLKDMSLDASQILSGSPLSTAQPLNYFSNYKQIVEQNDFNDKKEISGYIYVNVHDDTNLGIQWFSFKTIWNSGRWIGNYTKRYNPIYIKVSTKNFWQLKDVSPIKTLLSDATTLYKYYDGADEKRDEKIISRTWNNGCELNIRTYYDIDRVQYVQNSRQFLTYYGLNCQGWDLLSNSIVDFDDMITNDSIVNINGVKLSNNYTYKTSCVPATNISGKGGTLYSYYNVGIEPRSGANDYATAVYIYW